MAKCFFKKIGGSGSSLKSAHGTFATDATNSTSVNLGFKPKYLAIRPASGTSVTLIMTYNENYSQTTFKSATSTAYSANTALGGSANGRLYSINNNGFTVNKLSGVNSFDYFAIG